MPKDQGQIVVHLPLLAELQQGSLPSIKVEQLDDQLHDLEFFSDGSSLKKVELVLIWVGVGSRGGSGSIVEDRSREESLLRGELLLLLLLLLLLVVLISSCEMGPRSLMMLVGGRRRRVGGTWRMLEGEHRRGRKRWGWWVETRGKKTMELCGCTREKMEKMSDGEGEEDGTRRGRKDLVFLPFLGRTDADVRVQERRAVTFRGRGT